MATISSSFPLLFLVTLAFSGSHASPPRLISFSSLVSLLKARNNGTSPTSSSPPTSATAQKLLAHQSGSPVPSGPSFTPFANFVIPPLPEVPLCSPISSDKKERHALLCGVIPGESAKNTRADQQCVVLIPTETPEDFEDDLIETAFSTDVVVYTACQSVKGLFNIFEKIELTPKCFDCGK